MATYQPAKKNTALIVYVGLEAITAPGTFKSTPTLASGDFKVSIDGGALANLATLPTNTPASSKMVKISLSAGEMNGDNITVICSDAAGAEWNDLIINFQTVANQFDDLAATQTTIAGYIDTEVAAIKAKTDNLPASPANEATLTTIAGYIDTEVAAIKAKTDNLPASPANEATLTTIAGYIDTEVAAIKAKTDNLPASPAATGDAMTLAAGAITAAVIATDAIDADAIAASAVTKMQAGLSTLTTGQVDSALASYDAATGTEAAAISSAIAALPSAATVATAVWSAGSRTLTGFGTLVADIWAYATRTLTSGGGGGGATAAEVWSYVTRTLTSGGGSGGATAAEVWAYSSRTLTGVIDNVQVISTVDGGKVTVNQRDTWRFTLSNSAFGLSAYEAVALIVKRSAGETDDQARLYVRSDTGLERIGGAAPVDAGNGTLTIDSATDVSILISIDETDVAAANCTWWLKGFDSTPANPEGYTLASGKFLIRAPGLRATA